MGSLSSRLDKVIERRNLPWKRRGHSVALPIAGTERRHVVRTTVRDSYYRFTAVVLRAEDVPRRSVQKRDLMYRAWRKNALKELVTFTLDEAENLVGVIESPVETLGDAELVLYIETVAREADRFEYKLTGQDFE